MRGSQELDRCLSFIQCQMQPASAHAILRHPSTKLAFTVSRQTGSGAWKIAKCLASVLERRCPIEGLPWTIFDRELVEKVLEDHHLPKKLAQFMPEDRVSAIDDMMQEFLGLHPPSWTLVDQTTETILKLAELGNVILIGRGASVITSRLLHVVHVRLIGSPYRRVERVRVQLGLEMKAAREFLEKADRGRERYLKDNFQADISNALLYDLVLNTDRMSCEDAADLIAEAGCRRLRAMMKEEQPARP